MRWIVLPTAAAAVAMIATTGFARPESGKKFAIQMTGEEEVAPGDPDGTGTAMIRINPGRGQLCYTLRVRNIDPATAAHIHEAPAGVAGPVVVELDAPTGGSSSACVNIGREEAREILADPENYYVNVHNELYPGGAVRGQFG